MRRKTIPIIVFITLIVALIGGFVSCRRSSKRFESSNSARMPREAPTTATDSSKASPSFAMYEKAKYELTEIQYKSGLEFPSNLENDLIERYIYVAEGSPYYWQALSEIVGEAKLTSSNTYSREELYRRLQKFVLASWGSVKLGSNPKGAEVFVVKDGKLLPQGNTEIRYKYMEGRYSFKLKMNGYEDAWRNITVRADEPTEEIVELKKSQ